MCYIILVAHSCVHRPTLASKLIHQSLISFSMLDISGNILPCFKRTERKARCHTNLSPDYCNTLMCGLTNWEPIHICIVTSIPIYHKQLLKLKLKGGLEEYGVCEVTMNSLVGLMRVAQQVEVQAERQGPVMEKPLVLMIGRWRWLGNSTTVNFSRSGA